ncbi:MAG: alanine dehydrogenase [Deltaproteobacteria bacterium]|jgi:alanine dehydrogenase|nr:alanine dehydrogenase [Deltaproteobacteria bacterium]
MIVGCPKEIKDNENRVGLTPNAAAAYVACGHAVYVATGAGLGSAISDEDYLAVGAKIVSDNEGIWAASEMVVKVKEPLPEEYGLMRKDQLIYTFFHFAANEILTRACLERQITALAYETVGEGRYLPLLKPMSEVAGRMSVIMGAFYSAKSQGGRGLLPMGVTGVAPAEILILGGGVVGANAAKVAAGLGAKVTIVDIDLERLEFLSQILPSNVLPLFSDKLVLERYLSSADIVIGAVLTPGARTVRLVDRGHLKIMKPGAVVVDVAVDQGGCFETSRPTSHSDPIYEVDGIIHYCVANMPGAYASTSTYALNNATIKYGLELANLGVEKAVLHNRALRAGLNIYRGKVVCQKVAEAFDLEFTPSID